MEEISLSSGRRKKDRTENGDAAFSARIYTGKRYVWQNMPQNLYHFGASLKKAKNQLQK